MELLFYVPAGIIGFIVALAVYFWIFWGMYVLVMGLYRAYLAERLTLTTKVLGAPFLIMGLFVDVFANIFLATVIFCELPREWLVTQRLQRYMKDGKSIGYRYDVAFAVCENLLDLFDPTGEHC